jgi:long-chain acyl-CoA synthetase
VVVLRPGSGLSESDVIAYCKERVAAYKYPREVRFVAELPKGPTGKVLKTVLRDS